MALLRRSETSLTLSAIKLAVLADLETVFAEESVVDLDYRRSVELGHVRVGATCACDCTGGEEIGGRALLTTDWYRKREGL